MKKVNKSKIAAILLALVVLLKIVKVKRTVYPISRDSVSLITIIQWHFIITKHRALACANPETSHSL